MLLIVVMTTVIVRTRSAWYLEQSNITSIPPETSPGDPLLSIRYNTITHIPMDVFISYSNLRKLEFIGVPLYYIEEGAFRGQDKLERLIIIGGDKGLVLPSNLGPPTKSLISITFWFALSSQASVGYPYFAAFEQLNYLNLGGNHLKTLDVDVLPYNITGFSAPYNEIPNLPSLKTFYPLIKSLVLPTCGMRNLPLKSVTGLRGVKTLALHRNKLSNLPNISFMKNLENLQMHGNRLASTPDLYELSLTTVTLANNPLVCDKALCWIRMWPWAKTSTIPSDDPTCACPDTMVGMRLMDVEPVLMECFKGECAHNTPFHFDGVV